MVNLTIPFFIVRIEKKGEEMYKVVDTFNGWEGEERFEDYESAVAFVERDREKFYSQFGMQNAYFCKAVVPSSSQWQWSEHQHRFVWM